MINLLLRILKLFKTVFLHSGVQFDAMVTIIRTKLLIDNRITKNFNNNGKDKQLSNVILKQGLGISFMGFFSFLMPWVKEDLTTAFFFFHAMILVMFTLTFLSEYAQSLIEYRDTHILLRLPLNSRTISTAKFIAVGYYMMVMACFAMIGPFLILLFRNTPVTALLFICSVFLNTLFALLLTNLVYMLAIRFASDEKFKKILSYLQILLVIVVVIGYQIVAHAGSHFHLEPEILSFWWYFVPPFWFTTLCELPHYPVSSMLLPAILSVVIPIISAYTTLKWFAPYLINRLTGSFGDTSQTKEIHRKEKLAQLLASISTYNPYQKSAFLLTWRLSSGNTKFKEAILPGMAYSFVMFALAVFLKQKDAEASIGFLSIIPSYILLFAALIATDNLSYSPSGNLQGLYRACPIARPGQLLLGAFNAIYIKYFTPFFFLSGGIILCMTGISNWSNVLLIYLIITEATLITFYLSHPVFPFSREKSTIETGNVFLKMIITFVLCGIFIGIHFVLTLIPGGIIIGLILLSFLLFLSARMLARYTWKKIEQGYGNIE